jgi:hypothetical protein
VPLVSGLAAAQQIAFGQDADKLPGLIHHRQTADEPPRLRRFARNDTASISEWRVPPDRDDVSGS